VIIVYAGIVTLRFPSIKKGHAGVYRCVAEDSAGNKYTYDVPIQVVGGIGEGVTVCMFALSTCYHNIQA
jgi:hypothetical protein